MASKTMPAIMKMTVKLMSQTFELRSLNNPGPPAFWLLVMMLNRNYDYDFASNFVYDAVGKLINKTTPDARRKRRPGFRVMLDTLKRLFNFFSKLETQPGALLLIVVRHLFKFRLRGIKEA